MTFINGIAKIKTLQEQATIRLVDWSLTALSTQCRSYRAFKVRLY